uniref:Uncharacterized protein n=1 Tax=Lessonia variegata TaxID=549686 RepID=A0A8F0FCN2_9PHAE|nr:hypothetical protein [Lessonia variegata]
MRDLLVTSFVQQAQIFITPRTPFENRKNDESCQNISQCQHLIYTEAIVKIKQMPDLDYRMVSLSVFTKTETILVTIIFNYRINTIQIKSFTARSLMVGIPRGRFSLEPTPFGIITLFTGLTTYSLECSALYFKSLINRDRLAWLSRIILSTLEVLPPLVDETSRTAKILAAKLYKIRNCVSFTASLSLKR